MSVIIMIIPICVGGFLGFYLSKSYKKRVDILKETEEFISEIKSNVQVYKHPISEILSSFKFKTDLYKIIENSDFLSEDMTKEEGEELRNLIEEIGYLESFSAQNKLEAYKEKNGVSLENAKEEYLKKGVMYQKLGLLFGLLLGILWL